MPGRLARGNMTVFQEACKKFFLPEVAPFTYSFVFTFFLFSSLSWGGSKESRAASKYLNPPKH